METLTEMKMTGFRSNDPKDYEAVKRAIDEYLEEALDPETYAVERCLKRLKDPHTLGTMMMLLYHQAEE